jgi:hypothetical protein
VLFTRRGLRRSDRRISKRCALLGRRGVRLAGLALAPLIVVAVTVAYLTSGTLTAYLDARIGTDPAAPSRHL